MGEPILTETVDEQALLDAILERAAEELGDITPLVLDRFYARFPEARDRFEALWPGNAGALEGDMVERALYCIMMWIEARSEIEIMLRESVPQLASALSCTRHSVYNYINQVRDRSANKEQT